jgi:uncharacterized protein
MSASNLERVCALCGKPQDPAYAPFCSKRCADLDLARWLNGDYVIPDEAPPDSGLSDVPDRD